MPEYPVGWRRAHFGGARNTNGGLSLESENGNTRLLGSQNYYSHLYLFMKKVQI